MEIAINISVHHPMNGKKHLTPLYTIGKVFRTESGIPEGEPFI